MVRRWHLIDDDGRREVIVDLERRRIETGIKVHYDRKSWPAFTQLAIRAGLEEVVAAVPAVADEFDLPCRRITEPQAPEEHVLWFARDGDLVLAAEPDVEFENRFVTAASSEALAEHLATDAVHFGHDPSAESLHLTKYRDGTPVYTWCDSLRPGPSFALTFHDNGRCTEEDPRQFALRRVDGSGHSSALDRTAFLEQELAETGLSEIDPELREVSAQPVFAVDTSARQTSALS
jgi:hypothetical protein